MKKINAAAALILLALASALAPNASSETNLLTSDLTPKHGRGTPPRNSRGTGPWATRVMFATSTNGLDFKRLHHVLADQAGVPNVMIDYEGRARIYYVDYGNGNILACALQKDRSSFTNWAYRRVSIAGLPPSYPSAPVDPTVIQVSEGRYRMYFVHATPLPSIRSAISANGIDFVNEDGIRFGGKTDPGFDPTVLDVGATRLLWCGPDGKFFARSSDGLHFDNNPEFRVEGARFMPWSAVSIGAGRGYRLYGNFVGPGEWNGGVSSVFSTNGVTWKREAGIRLSLDGSRYSLESRVLPDNGCALLPSGTWLMAYLAVIPEPRRRP